MIPITPGLCGEAVSRNRWLCRNNPMTHGRWTSWLINSPMIDLFVPSMCWIVNQHSKFTTYQHPKVFSLEVAQFKFRELFCDV